MYKNKKVWGIVLAAGNGTRIGFDKMLYKIDGTSVQGKVLWLVLKITHTLTKL